MKQILIFAPLLLAAVPAAAQSVPSESQQKLACMGDALRLCPQHIPNRDQIIQCMAGQRASLSAGCRPVFEASYKALVARRQPNRF